MTLATGYYWIRLSPEDREWIPAHHDAGEWWVIGLRESFAQVAEVGPRLVFSSDAGPK